MSTRARLGKEDSERITERYGRPSAPAFSVPPLWIHAASVGEALSALTLISIARNQTPDLPVILTTGTVTSARVLSGRLPPNCVHQYAPLDHPVWINRFLNYWTPRAAIRIESEIWPTTFTALTARHIPLAMINGRMSDKSFGRWSKFPRTAAHLFGTFKTVLADGAPSAERFKTLGARDVHITDNIKFIADAAPADAVKLATLKTAIGTRPVWLYASTHADEETIAAAIHETLREAHPGLLTIIVPRHPARVPDIKTKITAHYRSDIGDPHPDTQIYVADTIGEMPLFYSASPIAVIGRSFSIDGGGGHNPIEPALYGCFPLSGPNVQNLQTIFDAMAAAAAVEIIPTPDALADRINALLNDPDGTKDLGNRSLSMVQNNRHSVAQHLSTFMHDFLAEGK